MFDRLLEEQTERHDGGKKWIGTGGASPFGHSGEARRGFRIGGKGKGRSAIKTAHQTTESHPTKGKNTARKKVGVVFAGSISRGNR